MKKFVFALFLVFVLSFSASATEFIIGTSSADLYTVETYSDDVTSEDVTEYHLTAEPYRFTNIKDALTFANDPATYLGITLADGEAANFPEVALTLDRSDSTASSIFGGEIKLSDYPNITTLDINLSGTSKTLYTPSSSARHFTFDSGATVSMKNLIFYGDNANGGLSISNGTVNLESIKFQYMNLSGSNGGAVSITGGSGHTFKDCEFTNNTASNGGAVSITGGSSISFSGTNSFVNNIASTNGGAILLNASGVTLDLNGITFDSNHAQNGGAVIVANGGLTVTDSTFTNNSADINGGAVYTSGGSVFTFTGSSSKNSFQSNSAATDGGALYISGGSSLVFNGTNEFDGNTAGTNGGAIAINAALSSTPTFSGITFNNNYAVNGGAVSIAAGSANFSGSTVFNNQKNITNGGALYLASSGTITVSSDVTFSSNNATNGGIIYASAGTVNLYCDLTGGVDTTNGGALYVNGSSVAVNVYGSITNNTATGCGGAIYIAAGTVNITNFSGSSTIEYNTAPEGGAIYLGASTQANLKILGSNAVTFANNTADTNGGAIYAGLNSKLSFTPEIVFNTNRALEGNGGALWLATSSQLPTGTITFNENSAERSDGSTDDTIGNGGAIYIGSATSSGVTINSSYKYSFTNNAAYVYGGAIYTLSSDIIFDGFSIDTKNTAQTGGGFASSGTGTITLRNSSNIQNQEAPDGGAIYAADVVVNNSYMSSNTATDGSGGAIYATNSVTITSSDFYTNSSEGRENDNGGGAIFSQGALTVADSYFYNNEANKDGAAIFVNIDSDSSTTSDPSITNTYFYENKINIDGNGGAVSLLNTRTATITGNTFYLNEARTDGGALCAQGKNLNIQTCYFAGNSANRYGGAVYFNQSSSDPETAFSMSDTMFHENKSSGYGGATYIATNTVEIKKCTFDNNFVIATSSEGYGGAVYMNTTINPGATDNNNIENCTFVENYIEGGVLGYSGGGAIAITCERTTMRSCTITDNASAYSGSGIYVQEGRLTISGTIVLGNTDIGAYDIWVDGNIASGGYNRIGVYGQGGGVTDFYSITRNDTDRTSYPSKTWMTRRSYYFGSNELDTNERTDLGTNIPPYIGSTRAGQVRLLTLMLSEDASVPLDDSAVNVIPYSRRQSFPAVDERGVSRRSSGGTEINLDVGAVFFDGTRSSSSTSEYGSYSISYIQISGVPNEIRRVGQTVSLIAKVYYTNNRFTYGGTGDDEEEVTWSASPSGYLRIDASTGVITALRVTQGVTYVTVTAKTVRTNLAGEQVSASARIKITNDEYSEFNNSPSSTNSDITSMIRELRQDFEEYNMGYGLAAQTSSTVSTSAFQTAFSEAWNTTSAAVVSNIEDTNPAYNYSTAYTASDGFSPSKGAGINVNLSGVNTGDILPLVYPWEFSGDELKTAIGSSLYNEVAGEIMAAYTNAETLSYSTAKKIFSALRIEFEGKNNSWFILGTNSDINLGEAINCGAIVLEPRDYGKGLLVKLNACIANVNSESYGEVAVANFDGPQIVENLLIIPDGADDGEIYGTMWLAQKYPASSSTTTSTSTNTTTNSQNNTQNSTTSNGSSGGGSGGGCNTGIFGFLIFVFGIILKKKRY